MIKVLITGATGLVGKEIVKQCFEQKYSVHYLTTSKAKIVSKKNYQGFYWNPSKNEIDISCLEGVTTIIHLAGASIAQRWTDKNKINILKSRVESASILFNLLKNQSHQVEQFISASAIGIYPHSLINFYSENTKEKSTSFLGQVVSEWEKSANQFTKLDIKVSKVRVGLVLDVEEGALPKIVNPIKFGLGSAFGSGKQWQSWIHKTDVAGIFMYILNNRLKGVFNAVAPNPITNKELTKQLAKLLKRSLFLPNIPKFVMKLILGEMHILLFESQRVNSKKIEDLGYQFKYYCIKPALENLLK
ncbi:TIGR01777 family oxidoreductase [Aurantibacter sp.]|uniref:TIGR01777 family oxidoreductase n=1 Tax=Aurantibacter sp. TaxID=2807103 RepID=UPI0035C796AB